MENEYDVVVIGAGPSGSAAAFWLSEAGHHVLLIEKKVFPREKTCGDGLTPRSVKQLQDMDLEGALSQHHRFDGLRSRAFGRTLELNWPSHPDFPSYGFVVTRHDLDELVAQRAEKSGATVWQNTEALDPIVENGLLRGAVVKRKEQRGTAATGEQEQRGTAATGEQEQRGTAATGEQSKGETTEVRGKYVIVSDGANSRFGRALGTSRNKKYPLGMAIRGYFNSPMHDDPFIESHLDLRDKDGNVLPGYGWIFPVGDGRINVGVGLLSTFNHWKSVNTTDLMNAFVDTAPPEWGISPETSCGPATGGKLPMSFSVGPNYGPTYLITGDAAGAINPFNGEGIAYAYETGRLAAGFIDEALKTNDARALSQYPVALQAQYGLYYKVARIFVRVIGRPEIMRALANTGMRNRTLMEWVLRIMSNMLRPDELGPAEAAYKSIAAVVRLFPAR